MSSDNAAFPSFLYRDGSANSSEIEPCEQIAACAGVAWAALKLVFIALYAMARVMACHGLLCAWRRLSVMQPRRAFLTTGAGSLVASFPIWIAGFLL